MSHEIWYTGGSTELLFVSEAEDVRGKFGLDVMGMVVPNNPRLAARVCFGECPADMELTTDDLLQTIQRASQALDGVIPTPRLQREGARALWLAKLVFEQEPGDWGLTDIATNLGLKLPGRLPDFEIGELPADRIKTEFTPPYLTAPRRAYPPSQIEAPSEPQADAPAPDTRRSDDSLLRGSGESWVDKRYL